MSLSVFYAVLRVVCHLDVVAAGVLVNVEGAVTPLLVTDLPLPLDHHVPHQVAVHNKVPDLR